MIPRLDVLSAAAYANPSASADRVTVRRVGADQAAVILNRSADIRAWRVYLRSRGYELVGQISKPQRPQLLVRVVPVKHHTAPLRRYTATSVEEGTTMSSLPTTTHVVTLSDGRTAVRNGRLSSYKHAVEIVRDGRSVAATWHATLALARQEAHTRQRRDEGVRVVAVAALPYDSPEAVAARAAAAR